MEREPKKTPLHERHASTAGKMADFRGWEMPLWYRSGAVAEHLAVITGAGLFDTSHMSMLTISGPHAFKLLQRCFTRDLDRCVGAGNDPLRPGRAAFGAFLNELGHVVDDAVVFHLAHESYMAVVNAGKGEEVSRHLTQHAGGMDVQVTDLTGKVGKLDLQGPASGRILSKVLRDPEGVLGTMGYFSFRGRVDADAPGSDTFLTDGTPIMVSRTGYTGEFGFELFVRALDLVRVWDALLAAGAGFGLIPCGLAARDSLRAGAVLPLSGQDIGPWPFINHPWHHALPLTEDETAFTKPFVGDVILDKRADAEFTHAFVGYDPRKVSIHDPAVVLDPDGTEIGVVLTCVSDMAIGRSGDRIYSIAGPDKPKDFKPKGLICGFVRVRSRLDAGRIVELKDNRRTVKVTIVDDIRPDRTALRPIPEMI